MAYADPSLQMQKAIVAWLANDPVVDAPVFDAVPGNAVKPYISFGPFQALPEHGDCLDGGEIFITLDCWANGPDTVEVKRLTAAVARSLDRAPMVLDYPQRMVEMAVEQIQYMRDPDGITAHGVVTVHAFTEPTD
jgi:hypothetical protein